jgi:hypothetical protein
VSHLFEEIAEIGEQVAQELFSKHYDKLTFAERTKGVEQTELFQCARIAQVYRLRALDLSYQHTGKRYNDLTWPEIRPYVAVAIREKKAIEQQKAELRKRGYKL